MTRFPILLVALALAVTPALPAASQPSAGSQTGAYKAGAGPWKAGSADLVLHDAARKKDLELTVRFPIADAGPAATFPLVVFSHGAGGSRAAFTALTTLWASHGYVVVLPTHADSIELRRRQGQDLSRLATNLDSLLTDVKPLDRLSDVSFVIESLGAIEQKVAALRTDAGEPPRAV